MLDAGYARLIADRFRLGEHGTLSGPVARGEQGDVWRLETDAGIFAVKEPYEPGSEHDVRAAADFQDAADAAGVPTPSAVRATGGSVLADVGGARIRVYRWVELRGPDIGLDPVLVGAVVAAIHRVRRDAPAGPCDWYTEPVGVRRWDEIVAALADHQAPFADDVRGLREELVALEHWLAPPTELQVCHRDLWADNLRGTPSGRLCVIDWDDSGPADPSQELACVLFEFASGDRTRARTLYDSYVDSGGPGRIGGRGAFSMLIAQIGHILERTCRLWLDDAASAAERAHRAAGVAEAVDRPHSRAVLDALLDAVTS